MKIDIPTLRQLIREELLHEEDAPQDPEARRDQAIEAIAGTLANLRGQSSEEFMDAAAAFIDQHGVDS